MGVTLAHKQSDLENLAFSGAWNRRKHLKQVQVDVQNGLPPGPCDPADPRGVYGR